MHDTFLLEKIFQSLKGICHENNIKKINAISFITSMDSHLDEFKICEYFKINKSQLIGEWTKIQIQKQELQEHTAIVHSIEGEFIEDKV